MKPIILLFSLWFFAGCGTGETYITQRDIEKDFKVDALHYETYYFPAKKSDNAPVSYLPLKPYDLIFAGHDFNSTYALLAFATPGKYTHTLMYLGKDSEGFAYGIEMNGDKNDSYSLDRHGLQIDGRLYVYCLGNDFGTKECPQDLYHNGLETYDYKWAKTLTPPLYENLMKHQKELIHTIKEDLTHSYPTQLPFHIGWDTLLTKKIPLVDDGRKNGADCTAYFVTLFEEVGKVCLEDVRMTAAELEDYYLYDPIGEQAKIPAQYNIFSKDEDLYLSTLFNEMGYLLTDTSRETQCPTHQIVSGVPVPQRLFESPDLIEITPAEKPL